MKLVKKLVAVLALSTVLVTAGCSTNSSSVGAVENSEYTSSEIVATINGVDIPESLYRTYLWNTQMFIEMSMGTEIENILNEEIDGQTIQELAKERALESVVLSVVAEEQAKALNISLTDEELSAIENQVNSFMEINGEVANFYQFGHADIVSLLAATEISVKVQEALGQTYMPSEEEIEQEISNITFWYEEVTARHILISTIDDFGQELSEEEKAEKLALINSLLDRIKSGEDIGVLAAEYSEDPGSAFNNGEYTFGRGQMVTEFEEAAFNAEAGEIWAEPIETFYGYHIGQTIEHIPANQEQMREEFIDYARYVFAETELMELIAIANIQYADIYDTTNIISREFIE